MNILSRQLIDLLSIVTINISLEWVKRRYSSAQLDWMWNQIQVHCWIHWRDPCKAIPHKKPSNCNPTPTQHMHNSLISGCLEHQTTSNISSQQIGNESCKLERLSWHRTSYWVCEILSKAIYVLRTRWRMRGTMSYGALVGAQSIKPQWWQHRCFVLIIIDNVSCSLSDVVVGPW